MNGWVRAKKSTRSHWFCPECIEKWTHCQGDSERWILVWEEEFDWEDFEDQRGPDWQRVKCLEPGEAAAVPRTVQEANEARGRPLIYKWGMHQLNIDTWADNVFTYMKRCALVTKLGDTEVTLENVIRTLRQLDNAHFQRLSESLNIENVQLRGFQGTKWDGVYSLECQNAFLSCRAIGQSCAVHQPQTIPSPLETGELVSLRHAFLALVDPETYDRSSNMGRQMTQQAIAHRNTLVPQLRVALNKLKLVLDVRSELRLCLVGSIPEVTPEVDQRVNRWWRTELSLTVKAQPGLFESGGDPGGTPAELLNFNGSDCESRLAIEQA
eukprot:3679696-Amphidinium_carterae.1